MAHAGTLDLGQNAKAARGGNPWLVLAVIVAIAAATIGAFLLTSGKGLTTSAALSRPAVDDGYMIEAQRGLVTSAGDRSFDQIENLRITAGTGPLVSDYNLSRQMHDGIPAGSVVAGGSVVVGPGDYSYLQLQQMHMVGTAAVPSATSGPFHAGTPTVAEPTTVLPDITSFYNPVNPTTSGAFIPGKAQAGDPVAPIRGVTSIENLVRRDRVGGP